MGERDGGTSNLIAFPGKAAADDASPAAPRDGDLIRRLETIATTIGVPVATFLGAAEQRSAATKPGTGDDGIVQTAELLRLFSRISDARTRDQCLNLLRILAASGPEAGRSR